MRPSAPPTPGRGLAARASSVLPASSRKQAPPGSAAKKFATLGGGLSSSDISSAAAAASAAAGGAGQTGARSASAAQARSARPAAGTSNISVVARIRPAAQAKDNGFADGRGRIVVDPVSGRQSIEMQLQGHSSSLAATTGGGGGSADAAGGRGSWSITPDAVIGPQSSQAEAYDIVARAHVESVTRGENACIMAYGQTGSGKTYTMIGGRGDDERGVLPRAFADLFRTAEERAAECEYSLRVSFIEVYQDKIYDLLAPPPPPTLHAATVERPSLSLRGIDEGVYVDGLTELPVASVDDAMRKLQPGLEARTTASTSVNCQSSRSHGLITVSVVCSRRLLDDEGRALPGQAVERRSVLEIVDLAGSERQKHTGAEGSTLAEASAINGSLSTLARVVAALQARQINPNTSTAMVPWRDSKLTQLLRRSLSGNARVMIVGAISASTLQWSESVSTLQFLDRARNVRGRPVVVKESRVVTAEAAQRFADENAALRAELGELRAQLAVGGGAAAGGGLPGAAMIDDDAGIPLGGSGGGISRALVFSDAPSSAPTAARVQSLLAHIQDTKRALIQQQQRQAVMSAPAPTASSGPSALAALVRAKQAQLDAAERQVSELQRLRIDLSLARAKLMVLEHEQQLPRGKGSAGRRLTGSSARGSLTASSKAASPSAAVTASTHSSGAADAETASSAGSSAGSKRKRAGSEEQLEGAAAAPAAAAPRPVATPMGPRSLPPLPSSDDAATPSFPTPYLQRFGVGDVSAESGDASADLAQQPAGAAAAAAAPAPASGAPLSRSDSMLSAQPVMVVQCRASAGSSQWGGCCGDEESIGPFRPSNSPASAAAPPLPPSMASAAAAHEPSALVAARQRAAIEAAVAERIMDAESALHLQYAESQAAAAEQLCALAEQHAIVQGQLEEVQLALSQQRPSGPLLEGSAAAGVVAILGDASALIQALWNELQSAHGAESARGAAAAAELSELRSAAESLRASLALTEAELRGVRARCSELEAAAAAAAASSALNVGGLVSGPSQPPLLLPSAAPPRCLSPSHAVAAKAMYSPPAAALPAAALSPAALQPVVALPRMPRRLLQSATFSAPIAPSGSAASPSGRGFATCPVPGSQPRAPSAPSSLASAAKVQRSRSAIATSAALSLGSSAAAAAFAPASAIAAGPESRTQMIDDGAPAVLSGAAAPAAGGFDGDVEGTDRQLSDAADGGGRAAGALSESRPVHAFTKTGRGKTIKHLVMGKDAAAAAAAAGATEENQQ